MLRGGPTRKPNKNFKAKFLKGDAEFMKAKKLLALLLAVALVVTQFAMLGSVFAETTALTGRETYFAKGVNIHSYAGYAAYTDTAKFISDAAALGSDIIRTNIVDDNLAYNVSVADMAAKKGMQVMAIAGFKYWENSAPIAAANIDIAGITKSFTEMATALNGKVAYYQINNEMCNDMLKTSSLQTSAYGYRDASGIAVGVYAAANAIKAVDPDAKIVLNFCWKHYGLLEAIKNVKIDAATGLVATSSTTNVVYADWDVTGFDWYYSTDERENYY